jgi:hypothetical protein
MGEYSTRVDVQKNRIYIDLTGYLSVEQARKLLEEYRNAVDGCKPDFTVLTVVKDFKPGAQEVQDIVLSMSELDENAGCRKVARVIGNNHIGGMQINRLVSTIATYPAQHFKTVEEAEAFLDSD